MHEMSLVQSLVRQVGTLVQQQQADRVVAIRVRIGEFSGVDPELFRSAYDWLIETSPIRGATLHLFVDRLESKCRKCGNEFAIQSFRFQCPQCASGDLSVLQGEDMILEAVTLETDSKPPLHRTTGKLTAD